MAICETTDFIYPLLADVFYPIVEVTGYGNVKKQWILDRTIALALNPAGRKYAQQIQTNPNITIDSNLVGRTRTDILSSTRDNPVPMTDIIIANVRDVNGSIVYNESSGIRSGKSTIFEIATFTPIVGAFGSTEYFKLVVARSDNQAADI
jgi:hypothetical protein